MKTLEWNDIFKICSRDNGGRWYASHEVAKKYIAENGYRSPSRAWPYSHAKPLMTAKFAKWAAKNHPEFAEEMGIVTNAN